MNQRIKNLLLAFVVASLLVIVLVAGFNLISNPTAQRIFQIFGGDMPGGLVQYLTFIAFFWGIFEMQNLLNKIKYERQSLNMNVLPEQEQWVLSPDDVNELKIKMIDLEKNHKYLIVDIIKKAATKFRADKSVSDVLSVVSSQIKINFSRAESKQSVIRYIAWAIPSLGFIGTILGIAQALGYAYQADTPEGLANITNSMYLAFDTTLVALLLSIIMMWVFHDLQEKEELLHTDMEDYLIENLVNRIHLE